MTKISLKFSAYVPSLIIVVGPTASGKSGLALQIAQRLNGVILGADSRQVYREFDIGTAKPSLAEQQQVPHYLIDICEPTETLTVADYQAKAQELIQQIHVRQEQVPLLVGGTGLYVNAIAKGLIIPRVAPQPNLRQQLTELGQPQCYAFLHQVDPAATQRIHPNDAVRTLRALEVYYATGHTISAQQGENPPNYPLIYVGLDCGEDLRQRIAQRTHHMIDAGLVDEVHTLINRYGADLPLLNTLGYAEIKQHLAGDVSLAEAAALVIRHTQQFAKRQRTWFRKEKAIEWFDANAPDLIDRVWDYVSDRLVGLDAKPVMGGPSFLSP
ncbi:tRNA (adenosine(37)-N6)-dimethylallyltransferase MiaA [Leptolyngbyaceae cyanobacterium CCMR0082]|uniref:tRNA dimethylallyltransferase n=2 Tax=Adonisia turfae TaxID=2950184 RepID=A0A6M0SHE5_9CYAN|nr:tRNA (adenosine(37)-N6)-dimethylallyltransferase MiaA [Adonisia turfae]NEZ60228.1 tRNA (adenosine(37)-N6)-dimethylallyltransferase MiaA [Adonisia turfae CCMR0081]NEZ67746.1 tRNA (adenosine(37)-N6)-dimethylallyltransferase MiaA [Adonisia turfae CCMR0082]